MTKKCQHGQCQVDNGLCKSLFNKLKGSLVQVLVVTSVNYTLS